VNKGKPIAKKALRAKKAPKRMRRVVVRRVKK